MSSYLFDAFDGSLEDFLIDDVVRLRLKVRECQYASMRESSLVYSVCLLALLTTDSGHYWHLLNDYCLCNNLNVVFLHIVYEINSCIYMRY